MPKIPTYQSQVGITVDTAPRLSTAISTGGQRESIQAIRETEQAMREAEDAMIKVRDFRESTEASNFLFDKFKDIRALAEEDINFDSSKYEIEIDKAIGEASKTITGELNKETFLLKTQRQADATKWGIKNMFRDKELKASRSSIDYNRKQILDNVGGMDEASTITSLDSYRKVLEDGVANNVIYKEFADYDLGEFKKDVAESQANYQVFTNPQVALSELERGEDGAFADMPSEQRAKYIKDAKRMIKTDQAQIKREDNEAMITNRIDTIERVASGEIDLANEPDLIRNMGVQDFRLGEAMKNSALKGSVTLEKESSEVFLRFAEDIFKSGTNEQITEFLINALENPNLSRDRLASLVYAAKKKGEELSRGEKQGFWGGLFDFFKGHSAFGEMDSMINTINRAKGENANTDDNRVEEIARDEIQKQRKNENPDIRTFGKEGQMMRDAQGNMAIVYPDGRIEEIK